MIFLNNFIKIPLLVPDYTNKKVLVFRTAPVNICKELISGIYKFSKSITILTKIHEKIDISEVSYIYYQNCTLNRKTFEKSLLKEILNNKFDIIIIPLNTVLYKDYNEVFKLALKLQSKDIFVYTINKDIFKLDKFYFIKRCIRNLLGYLLRYK